MGDGRWNDGTAAAQGTNTAPTSGHATTTANGNLLIGVVMTADFVSVTPGASFTLRDAVPANPSAKLAVEDRIQATAGSAAATASVGGQHQLGGRARGVQSQALAFRLRFLMLPGLPLWRRVVGRSRRDL